MKTKEQELQAAEEKLANEKTAIEAKYRVLNVLGNLGEYAPPFVHYHKLYGTRGSIHFNQQRYSSIAEGKSPDANLLRNLLTQFPPVAKVRVKDGCTSFRPHITAEGFNLDALKGNSDWEGDLYDCFGITVDIEPERYSNSISFKWVAVVSGELWEFKIEFPMHTVKVGKLDIVYTYPFSRHSGELSSIERCQFLPEPALNAQIIKWGSGDRKTPNRFTLYWDIDSGKAIDFPSLVKE